MMGYGRFCSASGMFVQCNIDSFETIRRRYIYGFKCRLQESNNSIVKCLLLHQSYPLCYGMGQISVCRANSYALLVNHYYEYYNFHDVKRM